jgi:cell division GTPase FtsZ
VITEKEKANKNMWMEAFIMGKDLLTFSGGMDLGLLEINDAAQLIADNYGDEETILFTVVIDESRYIVLI